MCQSLKPATRQADFKELAATEADSVVVLRRQSRTEKLHMNTLKTSADCKLNTCVLRLHERSQLSISAAINSNYSLFKRRNRNKDIRDKCRYMKLKWSSAFLLFWISVMLITFIFSCCSSCKHMHIGTLRQDHVASKNRILSVPPSFTFACARFHHFRINSPTWTRLLNWTSNQSSLSHRGCDC